ncbi:probable glutathione S-transferase GSTU6 [Hordeum vulgare subsp. vulgare]|uniref:probable glutathione S-transferase GSTU6 n=1 Tax=Hordeum vulgare subsp. vulgare TaxID=112509 RepID=UPI001D1A45DD|nr:probable glutathione S-transferase GSTU6 [Hordeum vulgare subsp. vulgare]
MAGEGEGVKLLGTVVSPFAVRVRMALHLKGVSYEDLEQDRFDKGDLLLASNPVHKKVPVLIHAGRPVCELLVIVEYVDEVWAGAASLLPADPYDRAVARFWAAYVDDKVVSSMLGILRATTEEERAERLDTALAAVRPLEDAFDACSGDKAFFAGDSIGYLDLALGCHLFWFEALREMFGVMVIVASRTPRLAAWAGRFLEREMAKKAALPIESIVEYAGPCFFHGGSIRRQHPMELEPLRLVQLSRRRGRRLRSRPTPSLGWSPARPCSPPACRPQLTARSSCSCVGTGMTCSTDPAQGLTVLLTQRPARDSTWPMPTSGLAMRLAPCSSRLAVALFRPATGDLQVGPLVDVCPAPSPFPLPSLTSSLSLSVQHVQLHPAME